MASVFLSLGSNIAPEANMKSAAAMLRVCFPAIRFSSVYKTKARDRVDQPDFLNAVAVLETDEAPAAIQERLREIEHALKKNPPYPQGPRTIDLDLLLHGDAVIETTSLAIPHPRMHQRRFVLEPLLELIEHKTAHPTLGQTWSALHALVESQQCDRCALCL